MPVDPVLAVLPQDLCHTVIQGLVRYTLALCRTASNINFIPVISKARKDLEKVFTFVFLLLTFLY